MLNRFLGKRYHYQMTFPLKQYNRAELPRAGHPGSFGFQRKHHKHEGIDLYGNPGDEVYAIADGMVTNIYDFTGAKVGMPWWNDTMAVSVRDATGSWVYGELEPAVGLKVGDRVLTGQLIGKLVKVLRKNKGRPTTMLHLERWKPHYMPFTMLWGLEEHIPEWLEDPTPYLDAL